MISIEQKYGPAGATGERIDSQANAVLTPAGQFDVQSSVLLEQLYHAAKHTWRKISDCLALAGARLLRFLAIPYAMATRVNWEECRKNGFLVFLDHLYIFFRLGYYPDNYGQCRLWEKDRREWKYYWGSGYDPRIISLLNRRSVQREDCLVLFEDKEVCYQLCHSHGLPLPRQYGVLDPSEDLTARIRAVFAMENVDRVLLKPVGGAGGKGICLVERVHGELLVRRVRESNAIPLDRFAVSTRCVIQEKVRQHSSLDAISGHSLNTIRMVTLMTPGEEIILMGAYLRFGTGESFVDNICAGGYSVALELNTGRSDTWVHNQRSHVRSLSFATKGAVSQFEVPHWGEVICLAKQVQACFAPFSRLLGSDIGISSTGPVLIEVNFGYDNTGLESTCGPILKDPVVRRAFLDYGIISHRLLDSEP
jgi:hypothetical protein